MALFRNHTPAAVNGQRPKPPVAPGGVPHASRIAAPPQPPSPPKDAPPEKGPYIPPSGFNAVREEVQQFLATEIKSLSDVGDLSEVRRLAEPVFAKALEDAQLVVSRVEREQMMAMIMADILGYGPIQPLLDRDDITEVMVNGPDQVYIELKGKLTLTNVKFMDNDHVLRVIERIVAPLGRRIDESSPMVDARLPDGSRVNAIIPPLSLVGPSITIRKFRQRPAQGGRPDPLWLDDAGVCRVRASGGGGGRAQHHHQRRHGFR